MGILILNKNVKNNKPITPQQIKNKIKEEKQWEEVENKFKQYLKTNNLNPSSEYEEYLIFEDFLVSHNLFI